jgi:hypothetical protein
VKTFCCREVFLSLKMLFHPKFDKSDRIQEHKNKFFFDEINVEN